VSARPRPGRPLVAALVIGALALFVLADLGASRPIDPFLAPAPAALGSGATPDGGHCSSAS
jgi:hypothetical protein